MQDLSSASLFYLLANRGLVPLSKLVRALRYQVERADSLCLSFAQILIAFSDVHHSEIERLRQDYGVLDEDPIGHLMVDSGHLPGRQLQKLREESRLSGRSLSALLSEGPAATGQAALLRDLAACDESSGGVGVLAMLQKRHMAMTLFHQRLAASQLLEHEAISALGLKQLDYLPLRFKPLLDLLILNGDWPAYLQPSVLVETTTLADEPLLRLICRPGLVDVGIISRLIYLFNPQTDAALNPAILLDKYRLLPREFLTHAVIQAYTNLAQDRRRQHVPSSD